MAGDLHKPMNVIVMGPRACGKTTIGRALAARLGRPFIDLDVETLRAFGSCASVSAVWRTHGEPAWREAELESLARILGEAEQVIALGGGTPTIPAAFDLLRKTCSKGEAAVIYLRCSADVLRARLKHERGDRPALRGSNPIDEVEQIVREREPIYASLASVTIDAAAPIQNVVDSIGQWLLSHEVDSQDAPVHAD